MDIESMTKEELIKYIKEMNESNNGKYGLIWDKEKEPEKIVEECNKAIPFLKEVSENNINNGGENNILIEGDNFHALSVLNYTHKEAVDIIYIDPPYNTGNEEFIYNDKYIDEEDGYKHSKWLNFMQKRLKIARNLLKEDGIIMVSINETEQAQLKLLMDAIFGNHNLLSVHHVQTRYANKDVANNGAQWLPIIEYVYIYAKNSLKFIPNLPVETYDLTPYHFKIEELGHGEIINVGGKKIEIFKKDQYKITNEKQSNQKYLKEVWGSGSLLKQKNTAAWYYNEYLLQRLKEDGVDTLYKIYNMGEDGLGYRYVKGPQKLDKTRGKVYQGVPLEKQRGLEEGTGAHKFKPIVNFYDFSPDFGNISHEGGVAFNSGKKPIKMIKELINYHTNKNAVVLDFFAGSGSTGHAVVDLNKEDGGKRRFILCTNNEISKKLQKEFMKKNNISFEELRNLKKNPDERWIRYTNENGICKNVTFPRIKNVLTGYSDKEALEGSLKYYKTEFVNNDSTRDQIFYDLTEKCVPMLCVKENTFKEVKKTDQYSIYTDEEGSKYTCVYFDIIGNQYEDFLDKIINIKGKKVLYIFTLGNKIEEPRLEEMTNYTIEAIPQRIYDLYKKLSRMSKEM